MTLGRLLDEMEITNFDRFERRRTVEFFIHEGGYGRFKQIFDEESGNLRKSTIETEELTRKTEALNSSYSTKGS